MPAERVLLRLDGVVQPAPNRYSIQVGEAAHLWPPPDGGHPAAGRWRYLNHACTPSARVDVPGRRVVALRDLEPGEEVTFDYTTTEWAMAAPFRCRCGSAACLDHVRGFAHLPRAEQRQRLVQAAPHVRALYAQFRAQGRSV